MAFGVGAAIFLMYMTHTTHPPGGATALIGIQGHAGFSNILITVLAGVMILLTVALFTNNVVHHRQYQKQCL